LTNSVVGALRAAVTRDELATLMEAVARAMDFRHYALIHHDDLQASRPDRVDLKDYPPAITERLFGQHRYRRDPVIRGCIFADSAFLWSDLPRIIFLDRQDRASFELGAREGLNEGITVPYVRLGDCMGSCTFAGMRRPERAHIYLGAAQMIGIRQVERIIGGLGFTTIREGVNAVEAWLSSLPGHVYANVRQPIVHTLNLAHLMPLSSVWAGPIGNSHLEGPPLLVAQTAGSTPFRLSTHVGDVGHMMLVGPTGAGKSVMLALIALQFRRYADAQVYIFDKGLSARAAVLAMGGAHHALGASDGDALAFQPLLRIDDAAERSWAAEWIAALLGAERVTVTPEVKDAVWSALGSLASAPPQERTMTGLALLLQSNALRTAIQPYTLDGPHGQLLDASESGFAFADVQCFETEALLGQSSVVAPVLTYLFHRLEERFDGRPTLLILDEAWIFLDHPLFAARIREWLKTLRKKNVAVLFATQSLADVAGSSIAPAVIESCPQRILLPNDRAIEPQSREGYARFGLNDRQIELISRATPKRHYYLQSARGNRLFELGLGPIALALCGASDPARQRRIETILAEDDPKGFAARFLRDADLDWAADLLADFPAP